MRPFVFGALAALAALSPAGGAAQSAVPSAPGFGFEIISTERWLHARQSPAFTAWTGPDIRRWLHVDSVFPQPATGARELHISQNFPAANTHLRLVHDTLGTVSSVTATYPLRATIPGQEYFDASMALFRGRARDVDRPAGFGTFEVDAMELIPAFHPPRLEAGAEWTDSVSVQNAYGESRFTLGGLRRSRLVRDTLIDGARHWIVNDSAAVELTERWQQIERTLDTVVVMERRASGTILGSYLFDPATGFFRERGDTVRLAGETALHYPAGEVFRVPARYERQRRWRRYEAGAAAARREETLAALSDSRSMIRLPRDSLETRLHRGEPALLDSLVGEWHRVRVPEERMRLQGLIAQGARGSDVIEARLRALALEAGDTVAVLRSLLFAGTPNRPLQVDDLELLLPLLRDPGVALAFGVEPGIYFGDIREALLRYPPAITSDPSQWPCTPQACRLLAAQIDTPDDARLRDLGLIAAFVMDPARWEAALRQRAGEGSAMVSPAMDLLAGVGATWATAARLPLPSTGATWRAWLEWMGALHPDLPPPPATGPAVVPNPLRFGQAHYTAIRFFEARTGRPVSEEIRRGLNTAESDSARLVFGTIRQGLGESQSDPAAIASAFASGSATDRALALREMPGLFRVASGADSALTEEVVGRILAIAIEGAEPWPLLPAAADDQPRRSARQLSAGGPILILSDSLPPGVRERWRQRAELITSTEWEARSPRRAAVLFVPGAVLRSGPFVRASISYQARNERGEEESPYGYAGGFSVFLMETPDGWVVVQESTWIT